MKKFLLRSLIAVALAVAVPAVVHAQEEGIGRKEAEHIQAKKKKDDKKAAKKADKENQKQHLGIQDKATRKRIKQHTKRANKNGTNTHRDPFFVRLFGRRH
ncbi:MAG: hypothetical protein ABI599_06860 [Flavobacteriales bacterium]